MTDAGQDPYFVRTQHEMDTICAACPTCADVVVRSHAAWTQAMMEGYERRVADGRLQQQLAQFKADAGYNAPAFAFGPGEQNRELWTDRQLKSIRWWHRMKQKPRVPHPFRGPRGDVTPATTADQ